MNGLNTKLNKLLKSLFNPKGQGLVEFSLTLAFYAAIGLAVREAEFGEAIHV